MCELISIVCLSQVCFAFYNPAKRYMKGNVVTIAGNGTQGMGDGPAKDATFYNPCGLCFREVDECLYIADYGNNSIRKFDTKTGIVSTVAGSGDRGDRDGDGDVAEFRTPADVKLTKDSESLLVADMGNERIRLITLPQQGGKARVSTLAGGQRGALDGGALECRLYGPHGVCIDDNGVIYISDTHNNRIRKLA